MQNQMLGNFQATYLGVLTHIYERKVTWDWGKQDTEGWVETNGGCDCKASAQVAVSFAEGIPSLLICVICTSNSLETSTLPDMVARSCVVG
jgi:hypothetical protein